MAEEENLRTALAKLRIEAQVSHLRPSRKGIDITDEFTKACQDLKTGQLIKNENFSLWDAVQALEIMDPKMDSGAVEEEDRGRSEFDVRQNLLPRQVLWIMDEILCRETAWLRGFALFQTLLTSEHLLHLLTVYQRTNAMPEFIKDGYDNFLTPRALYTHLCLRAFCLATIIQCDMNIELVASQQYYEEEDLNTQTYGWGLCTNIGDNDSIELLDESLEWLDAHAEYLETVEIHEAISHRLRFRRYLMSLFVVGESDPALNQYRAYLDGIEQTHRMAKPMPEAFDSKAYRKVPIGAPTRAMATVPFMEAVSDLRKLHMDLREGYRLKELGPTPNANALRLFLWRFNSWQSPPSALARAKMQAQLFADGGPLHGSQSITVIVNELRSLGVEEEILSRITNLDMEELHPSSEEYKEAKYFQAVVQKAFPVLTNSIRALCENSCRIRRCLSNSIQEWLAFDQDMTKEYGSPGLQLHTVIKECITFQQAQWIVQLGFEHDIYESYELSLLYRTLAYTCLLPLGFHLRDDRKPLSSVSAVRIREFKAHGFLDLGVSTVYMILLRLGCFPQAPNNAFTSPQKMWDARMKPLRGLSSLPESIWDYDKSTETLGSNKALKRLAERADEYLVSAKSAIDDLWNDSTAADRLFEQPPSLIKDPWKAELNRMRRVVVQMRLQVNTLKKIIFHDPEWDDTARGTAQQYVDRLVDGYSISVKIPTFEERQEIIEKTKETKGHRWWIVPDIEVKEESPLEAID